VIIPPASAAVFSAAKVHEAGVPVPTTAVGEVVYERVGGVQTAEQTTYT
jgi:hypothetical protein